MRTNLVGIPLVAVVLLSMVFIPIGSAQGNPPTDPYVLFMTDEVVRTTGGPLDPCGTQRIYNLSDTTPPVDTTPARAYLNRALLEANAIFGCKTDFEHNSSRAITFVGDATVAFPLNCEHLGVIQAVSPLRSVRVTILLREATSPSDTRTIGSGDWTAPSIVSTLCQAQTNSPYNVHVTIPMDGTQVNVNDHLTVRVDARAANTEANLHPYWYIQTGPQAKLSGQVEQPPAPECSDTVDNDGDGKIDFPADPGCDDANDDDETDTPNPMPECSDTIDNDGDGHIDFPADPGCDDASDDDETDDPGPDQGSAPECARDEPADAEITRNAGAEFNLQAVCTDPDDDLDRGFWTVNDEPQAEDELGPSPAIVDEDFRFDEPGTYVVEVTPEDQMGNIGTPATWVVHVIDDSGDGEAPICIREEPADFAITAQAGEAFTLVAECTDADDDMTDGDWVVDGDVDTTDELGDSPSTVDEEFEFNECGEHRIHFTPRDAAGNTGSSAAWSVNVTGCETTPTTPIPVFPSAPALLLGAIGAIGGGFVIMRRRA